ncbi:MAG: hypothetical protein D6708_06950 [Candidatus Dadabacteria bacterium]|nr:MAG: hypothetical protein D6708_06950 [Candidatus Dadabacteria bacterium]
MFVSTPSCAFPSETPSENKFNNTLCPVVIFFFGFKLADSPTDGTAWSPGSRSGLALVVAAVDPAGAVVWGPRVELRGVVPQERSGEEAREAEAALEALVRREAPNAPSASDWEALFTLALRRHFRRRGNRRPVVVATVAEV